MEPFELSQIAVNETLADQQEVFNRIASIAVKQGIASSKELVIEGLMQREKEGTTGFMDGFAIPHTKQTAIRKASVIVLKLSNGIEWESMDGEPVRFVISLLIPEEEASSTHLTLLSNISRMLMHSDVRQSLLRAEKPEEVLATLERAQGEL